jgi:hypothetical protein
VDTATDLERLRVSLTTPGATIARHTARFIAERGR